MITLTIPDSLRPWWELLRFHRPVGILLLLWPTWWALWLAADGPPSFGVWLIFTLGVIVMRAAGCVINDIADKNFDSQVARTQQRPLVTGALSVNQALMALVGLLLLALLLVLLTNPLTIYLAFGAAALACIYPFMKRYTHLPQVVLGAAFSMSIPMAFAAQTGTLAPELMVIYVTNLLWIVTYDTFYGMTDREYDKHIGVKSTAILFEGNEALITGTLQLMTLGGLWLMAQRFELGLMYKLALAVVVVLMVYQQWLLSRRQAASYFAAFMNNQWLGLAVFVGIALDHLFG